MSAHSPSASSAGSAHLPSLAEVTVPVATVWTSPQAPREVDEAVVRDLPDPVAWLASLDAAGAAGAGRAGLHGRTLTQLLLGEPAVVVEDRGDWVRVVAPWQASSTDERGYPGWVRRAHLGAPVDRADGPTAYVAAPTAACRVDDGMQLSLSCGTVLWVEPSAGPEVTVLLPGGRLGTLPRDAVRLSDKSSPPSITADGLLATARQFLGRRYLWGGTGAWGLDCSGLVHLAFRAHGRLLPRDACDQATSGHLDPVPLDGVRAGDLYFFARADGRIYHVGLATGPVGPDGARPMLHAPETGGLIEDAPMSPERLPFLVSAARPVGG